MFLDTLETYQKSGKFPLQKHMKPERPATQSVLENEMHIDRLQVRVASQKTVGTCGARAGAGAGHLRRNVFQPYRNFPTLVKFSKVLKTFFSQQFYFFSPTEIGQPL